MKRSIFLSLIILAILSGCKIENPDNPIQDKDDSEFPESQLYGHYSIDSLIIGNQVIIPWSESNELYINSGKNWTLHYYLPNGQLVLNGGKFTKSGDSIHIIGTSAISPIDFRFQWLEDGDSQIYDGIGIDRSGEGSEKYYIEVSRLF